MRHKAGIISAILMTLMVSACSTTPVGLTYQAPNAAAPAIQGKPVIDVTSVSDQRKHDPNWLGAIRGGMGQPLKTLETQVPVKDVVKAAFIDGLKARNLQTADAPYAMELTVRQFDCNQYLRREAHAKIEVKVVERASKRSLFQHIYEADKITDSELFDAGIYASVEDLRVVANQALQEVVDRALDDPQLRASLP